MSFTYNFDSINDKVQFAYCIPYTYSHLLNFIRQVCPKNNKIKYQTAWRSLSGLPVPLIQITDFQQSSYNKKIVLVTARIHPGQSNSSHVCQGFIKTLCSQQSKISQILKKFHFYIIPMLNPDGVVAGNYRTSLFGKDLNRTFNQSRKYAFPQSLNLIQLAKALKKEHKQKFTIYLDLHGHSVKKNIFFYGPDYSIAHSFYTKCREFARILGNLTPMFRYYSCAFHISLQKSTTARATFNRIVNIPFTYTVQSSNGAFYDSIQHTQKLFNVKYWAQMGNYLVRGLYIWAQSESFSASRLTRSVNYINDDQQQDQQIKQLKQKQPPGKQKLSDDEIQQVKSDSEPADQDLNDEQLSKIQQQLKGKSQNNEAQNSPIKQKKRQFSPEKIERPESQRNIEYIWSTNLRESVNGQKKKQIFKTRKQKLPPINLQVNPVQFLANFSHKKRVTINQALNNMTCVEINPNQSQKKQRLSISQMMITPKDLLAGQQQELVLPKKLSRQDLIQKLRRKR